MSKKKKGYKPKQVYQGKVTAVEWQPPEREAQADETTKSWETYIANCGFPWAHEGPRYAIVATDTGEVLDTAQGYGYKSKQAALSAWSFKTKELSQNNMQ